MKPLIHFTVQKKWVKVQCKSTYTGHRDRVNAEGATLDEVLYDLDRQYPGIRFRMINEQDEMRPHIVFFVRGEKSHPAGPHQTS